MSPIDSAISRFFNSVYIFPDHRFGSILATETFTVPFFPLHRLDSTSLQAAVLALASIIQVGKYTAETLRCEMTLCAVILKAIQTQDFTTVFYSSYIRCIIFSMSTGSVQDAKNECLGLSATHTEIWKRREVEPQELFTMTNCFYHAIQLLGSTILSSQYTTPFFESGLESLSEQNDSSVLTLPESALDYRRMAIGMDYS